MFNIIIILATISGRTRITENKEQDLVIHQLNDTKLKAIQDIWDSRFAAFVENGLKVDISRRNTKRFYTIVQNTLGTCRKNYLLSLIPEDEKQKKKSMRKKKVKELKSSTDISEGQSTNAESRNNSDVSEKTPE